MMITPPSGRADQQGRSSGRRFSQRGVKTLDKFAK
jgi:hypothetical protein